MFWIDVVVTYVVPVVNCLCLVSLTTLAFLLICCSGYVAVQSRNQLHVQKKDTRNHIIFGALTVAVGLLPLIFKNHNKKDDMILKMLESRKPE